MASKVLNLQITLRFSDPLTPEIKQQAAQNVLEGLKHTADTAGIVPNDVDGYTKQIEVLITATGEKFGWDMVKGEAI